MKNLQMSYEIAENSVQLLSAYLKVIWRGSENEGGSIGEMDVMGRDI